MSKRNPLRDQVVIVGVGSTKYGRNLPETTLELGMLAATRAIEDAGLTKADIDGVIGGGLRTDWARDANYLALIEGLGLNGATYVQQSWLGSCLVYAAHAVFSGACDTLLLVQAYQRDQNMSSSAGNDPLRGRASAFGFVRHGFGDYALRWAHSAEPYAAWAGRYMHEYNVPREVFGMVAVNNRTNATMNPNAGLRTPIGMDDYLNARQIREPLGMLDMDFPIDCGEALVLTTAERAKDLAKKPVYIHAATIGQSRHGLERYENGRHWTQTAPWFAMRALWSKTDYKVQDMDLYYPYDGFTPISISFTEASCWCKPGETYDFFKQSWDKKENRLKLNGKTLMLTNGGGLSHGRAGGFNFYTEAVRQLRGEAEEPRQKKGAKTALVGIGSFYHDPSAVILRSD